MALFNTSKDVWIGVSILLTFPIILMTEAEGMSVDLFALGEYNDVVFENETIVLRCIVTGTDVAPNIALYLDDIQIYGRTSTGSFADTGNEHRQFDLSPGQVQLVIESVRVSDAGNYTCRAQTQSVVVAEYFILDVALDWPQCIPKCRNGDLQYLCYAYKMPGYFMTWQMSSDAQNFELYTNFRVICRGSTIIGTSNNVSTPRGNDTDTYRCEMISFDQPSDLSARFCTFPPLTSRYSCDTYATNTRLLCNTQVATAANENETGATTISSGPKVPNIYTTISTRGIAREDDTTGQLTTFILIGVGTTSVVLCIFSNLIVYVVSKRHYKKSASEGNRRRKTRANHTGITTNVSFVNGLVAHDAQNRDVSTTGVKKENYATAIYCCDLPSCVKTGGETSRSHRGIGDGEFFCGADVGGSVKKLEGVETTGKDMRVSYHQYAEPTAAGQRVASEPQRNVALEDIHTFSSVHDDLNGYKGPYEDTIYDPAYQVADDYRNNQAGI